MDYGLTNGRVSQSAEGGQESTQATQTLKPKRMLERRVDESGKIFYRINSSSLSVIQECLRKAQLQLFKGLRSEDESPALTFGKALHKALEYWYTLPRNQRSLDGRFTSDIKLMQAGHAQAEPFENGVLESMRQFVLSSDALRVLPPDDLRSIGTGIKIFERYIKFYENDPFVVMRDIEGPLIERDFEFVLFEDNELQVVYMGTIDCMLQNEITAQIVCVDHKTSTRMNELASRAATSHQITGYIMAAHRSFNLPSVDTFIINGIQVAKTVHNLQRFPTTRTQQHFTELTQAVLFAIHNYENAIELNFWPQTAPGPCANYGGCPMLDVCSAPEFLKKTILENKYGKS